jgi:hypothetical protein
MENPDLAMRAAAGLAGNVDQPGYDKKETPMFKA